MCVLWEMHFSNHIMCLKWLRVGMSEKPYTDFVGAMFWPQRAYVDLAKRIIHVRFNIASYHSIILVYYVVIVRETARVLILNRSAELNSPCSTFLWVSLSISGGLIGRVRTPQPLSNFSGCIHDGTHLCSIDRAYSRIPYSVRHLYLYIFAYPIVQRNSTGIYAQFDRWEIWIYLETRVSAVQIGFYYTKLSFCHI